MKQSTILNKCKELFAEIEQMEISAKVEIINEIKQLLHNVSPFKGEPVDCVLWVRNEQVIANDYNPNSVAPPEMELLKHSIQEDGYTQPVVTFERDGDDLFKSKINEVVDGFHRTASTIRHNRARGKHKIESMSDIVVDLKRRNWSDQKIAKNLGMDADEILRLTQISGLAEMFVDKEFSEAWEAERIAEDDTLNTDEEA
jgi:ParB-like chromosome segregation protein Spo0J